MAGCCVAHLISQGDFLRNCGIIFENPKIRDTSPLADSLPICAFQPAHHSNPPPKGSFILKICPLPGTTGPSLQPKFSTKSSTFF